MKGHNDYLEEDQLAQEEYDRYMLDACYDEERDAADVYRQELEAQAEYEFWAAQEENQWKSANGKQ